MSLPFLYLETIGNGCAQFKSPSLLSHFSLIYYGFRCENNLPKNSNHMLTHSSRCHHHHYCHYCNVGFVLFHNVTCFTNSVLSHIHLNAAGLLNIITCTVVATGVILGRLEFTNKDRLNNLLHSAQKRHHWVSDWISSSSCWISIVSSDPNYLQTAHPGHKLQ